MEWLRKKLDAFESSEIEVKKWKKRFLRFFLEQVATRSEREGLTLTAIMKAF